MTNITALLFVILSLSAGLSIGFVLGAFHEYDKPDGTRELIDFSNRLLVRIGHTQESIKANR